MTLKEAYSNLIEYYDGEDDNHKYIQESWKVFKQQVQSEILNKDGTLSENLKHEQNPSNIKHNYTWAMKQIQHNRKIRRRAWISYAYIHRKDNKIMIGLLNNEERYTHPNQDQISLDWELYQKPITRISLSIKNNKRRQKFQKLHDINWAINEIESGGIVRRLAWNNDPTIRPDAYIAKGELDQLITEDIEAKDWYSFKYE
jgi:hypothetical protein